jgi:hypothetical protein
MSTEREREGGRRETQEVEWSKSQTKTTRAGKMANTKRKSEGHEGREHPSEAELRFDKPRENAPSRKMKSLHILIQLRELHSLRRVKHQPQRSAKQLARHPQAPSVTAAVDPAVVGSSTKKKRKCRPASEHMLALSHFSGP